MGTAESQLWLHGLGIKPTTCCVIFCTFDKIQSRFFTPSRSLYDPFSVRPGGYAGRSMETGLQNDGLLHA